MHDIVPRPERIHTPPDDSPNGLVYDAATVLDIALEAYRRGLSDGRAQAARERWADLVCVDSFRAARIRTEVSEMKRRSQALHAGYGYPAGYEYRGGPVDWATGMPEGSGCAWLRRNRRHNRQVAA